ncbi:MAG TPA: 30S ribosomal protein S12 methylthiotransferase RimO [Gemmatimonadaceae bacterium]|nr:30S ribosomal protein S12 methylthiotransferase RimO [Gemmatimonadaceae bacterium]
MRFSVLTLGCDKNTVDSERYRAELLAHGGKPASLEEAEVIVVNTCGFIDAAKRESIEAIVDAARYRKQGHLRVLAAVGCMVQRYEDDLRESLPEVDLFLGASQMERLVPELVERGVLDQRVIGHPGDRVYDGDLAHVRYLKVSEGCDHGCAFCAIPLMRGRHRSFALGDVVREAQLLELQGAREINLVAQDLAHYGRDIRDGNGLAELLGALLRETDIPWYRLLYIYSAGLTPRLLETIANEPRIVRYLDIPMQHASDNVLARMRRPERRARQREKIHQIRESIPGVAIRTTVIVGFPGETDSDVQELCDFLEEVRLERVGVFTFSRQEGTRAYELADDVPEDIKRERQERVLQLQRVITAERYERLIDQPQRAIIDRPRGVHQRTQARLEIQADDIDGVTWLDDAHGIAPGTLVEVIPHTVDDFDFEGTIARVTQPATGSRRQRVLPLAEGTIGSFGR